MCRRACAVSFECGQRRAVWSIVFIFGVDITKHEKWSVHFVFVILFAVKVRKACGVEFKSAGKLAEIVDFRCGADLSRVYGAIARSRSVLIGRLEVVCAKGTAALTC